MCGGKGIVNQSAEHSALVSLRCYGAPGLFQDLLHFADGGAVLQAGAGGLAVRHAPLSWQRLMRGMASSLPHPLRPLTVTGIFTRRLILSTTREALSKSFSMAEPAPLATTFRTGQPMLMSTMSTPSASTMAAASSMRSGSPP